MRLLFLGSGEFGLPTLEHLCAHHDVAAVISQPDRPAGRKRVLTPTPIAAWAQEHGMTVLKEEDANTQDVVQQVRDFKPDASVVVAFGQKLSPQLIDALGGLVINLHSSLLPKYRGAAPINWAMIQGDKRTGVSVIGLAQRMDAGPVYAKAELDISPRETAGELHDRLAQLGPKVVSDVLDQFQRDALQPEVQDEAQASKAPKLSIADGTVDFDQPADLVRARIHGLTPWPGCRVDWQCQATGKTETLMIRRVQAMATLPDFVQRRFEAEGVPPAGTVLEPLLVMTGQGLVKLLELQAPGTRPMKAEAFARGHHLADGDVLSPRGQ